MHKRSIPPDLAGMVTMRELQQQLAKLFPSEGSLEWEIRRHRPEYIAGGALFEVAGRLLAHAPSFERIALEIGLRKMATRHGVQA